MTTDERLAALEAQMAELLATVKGLTAKPPPKPWLERIDPRTALVMMLAVGLLVMYLWGRPVTEALVAFVTTNVTWWLKSIDERQNDQRVTQALYSSPPPPEVK